MAYLGVKPAAITSATQAEISGDLTVDTNTLKVDSGNNRVGVGTTSPSEPFHIVGASGAATDMQIQGGDDTNSVRLFMGGDTNPTNGRIVYSTASDFMAFSTGGDQRVRVDSHGLKFGSDTAAANALDDYEQGTFTPTPTVGTVSLADAAYTKIGRKVTVTFNVFNFSDRSSTSHIEFTNLPFTSDSSIGSTANAGMHRYVNAGDALAFYIPRNQTKIQLFSLNSGSNWTPTQYAHLNNSNSDIYVHLTYFAT